MFWEHVKFSETQKINIKFKFATEVGNSVLLHKVKIYRRALSFRNDFFFTQQKLSLEIAS